MNDGGFTFYVYSRSPIRVIYPSLWIAYELILVLKSIRSLKRLLPDSKSLLILLIIFRYIFFSAFALAIFFPFTTSNLSSLFPLPKVGATSYTFTMSSTLFGMLGNFPGKHDFTLTVIDQANPANSKSATLTINL